MNCLYDKQNDAVKTNLKITKSYICWTEVCISDCNNNDTKLSSLVASNMAASSATLGWNNWDLLFNVDGKGVGSGSTGSTEIIFTDNIFIIDYFISKWISCERIF